MSGTGASSVSKRSSGLFVVVVLWISGLFYGLSIYVVVYAFPCFSFFDVTELLSVMVCALMKFLCLRFSFTCIKFVDMVSFLIRERKGNQRR